MRFWWKKLLKAFFLGNLACAQETRWLRVAWGTRTLYIRSSHWLIPNTARAQSVDYLRVGRSMFHLLMKKWNLFSFSLYSWISCVPWSTTTPWTLLTITAPFRRSTVVWKPALTWVRQRLPLLLQRLPRLSQRLPLLLQRLPLLLQRLSLLLQLMALLSKYQMSYCCWCSSWEQPSFIKFFFVKKGKKSVVFLATLGLGGCQKAITKYMGSPPMIESVGEGVEGVCR